jgi:Zn-dependent M28 family amino/carboxypeptidase
MSFRRTALPALVAFTLVAVSDSASLPKFTVTTDTQATLDRISASSMRGHLSFIASDELEGRATPSRGLDLAAEYIAAQFRRAGLEPLADGTYFQTAKMTTRSPNMDGFALTLTRGDKEFSASPVDVRAKSSTALDVSKAVLLKADSFDDGEFAPESVAGKVVVAQLKRGHALLRRLRGTHPAALIVIQHDQSGPAEPDSELFDPEEPPAAVPYPRILVRSAAAEKFYESLHGSSTGALATIHLAPPVEKTVEVRNVAGVLRGSDPTLKDTYELVTAHYDHLGVKPFGEGDRIYNGANDDGSGTVSVIELATALAQQPEHPRRSIVFMTFFGEEEGLIGSKYYARHPLFPADRTVADINLEQMGRTDATEGRQIATASPTGFGYSNLTDYFRAAGEQTGIKINHSRKSDLYFGDSDNLPLARIGIPAETLCVAFEFPDYHAVGDEWQKIDYDNMAKVDRMVALAVLMIANNPEPPQWKESSATAPYVKARREQKP